MIRRTTGTKGKRNTVVLTVCVVIFALALIRPTLGKHSYGGSYRSAGYYHGPNRHVTFDVTDSAPDLQPLDLGWTAQLALTVTLAAASIDHWQALRPDGDDAPPGSLVHRKICPARADDPDLLA